ncbi:unnamed protein product [Linum trigynum]|uniref:Uncharacterized protein n=1 Tax=Linum trigynum TaxID=586398 RepID=A0AAV2F959_9ROSI
MTAAASIDVARRHARPATRQRGISPDPSASVAPKPEAEGRPRHQRLILEEEWEEEFIFSEIPSPMLSNTSTKAGGPHRRCPSGQIVVDAVPIRQIAPALSMDEGLLCHLPREALI